jgi:hypothetical protein
MAHRVARTARRTTPSAHPFDPMRLERRGTIRLPASGGMVATFRGPGGRVGLTPVELLDTSDGGLGLRSPVAIEPGMTVTLRDPRTRQPWSDAACVRCTREPAADGGGYRVGLRLGRRLAA